MEATASGVLRIRLSGSWDRQSRAQSEVAFAGTLPANARAVEFDTTGLQRWDSRLVALVRRWEAQARVAGLEFRDAGLPEGVRDLLKLARTVPEATDAGRPAPDARLITRIGNAALLGCREAVILVTFLGELARALVALVRGRARFRWGDLLEVVQEAGPEALAIVALINFLIGLILAFVGANALAQFGARIYVADMVAIGTTREMGAIMTAIIMCGRTGAAFAARLGTMKVNEEIAALETFGISPMEFLVLPRMIGLVTMMPILVVFANLISISGGLLVSVSMPDVTATEYLSRTLHAITLKGFLLGVSKGAFFGFLVAFTGCLRGMQCGTNAEAVGRATTQAVVAGITAIIAADGVFAVICNALGI